ncbi:MAG: alanine--tRNA ligase [Candidatus Omnitrophica bacterium]|nr:alanine--tRNA ligase [Candidatus Omnitrophota bacterium]
MRADILREKFLDFFKSKNHRIIDSDSLVPKNDPTVLFTPAGMNQFKQEFLSPRPRLKRVATCQRCLRTDDLDKVGKTSYHHTFFEMLGNFSFGDYFKKEAIEFAWEFLTKSLKIKEERLWISVYVEDEESYNLWKDTIKIPSSKIIKLDDKTNFWPQEAKTKGPDGPCGPCSEIFFDRGEKYGCAKENCYPGCDCGRFVEIWNLVFTQFNRKPNGNLEPLPKKNIDTGMGLERLASVMQEVDSNFETDLFVPIIKEITSTSRIDDVNMFRENIYAIADHIRAITFAIYDGVLPSNEERGYVVRKLIRRSIMHIKRIKIKKPFLYKLIPVVARIMKNPYPDLIKRQENISQIVLEEEKNYLSILESSKDLFKEAFAEFLKGKDDEREASRIAFKLYDTYGIPLELTEDFAHKHGFRISYDIFNQLLLNQRRLSQKKSVIENKVFVHKGVEMNIPASKFLGYKLYEAKAKILKIDKVGENFEIILDKTAFYPESGGQIADTGTIEKGKNIFEVLDTQKRDNIIVHIGRFRTGRLKEKDYVLAKIDYKRRISIARNHTATHLLQSALRKVLGEHVQQQGSYVGAEYLRFDFSHFKPLTFNEIRRLEEVVNGYILENDRVIKKEMTLRQAKKLKALAFFEEKYEKKVRVVIIGDYSKELCGGTHLDFTSEIGIFRITGFSSVAQGIKRIEAKTGWSAYEKIKNESDLIQNICEMLNTNQENLLLHLEKRIKRLKELQKTLSNFQLEYIKSSLDKMFLEAEQIRGLRVIFKFIADMDIEVLRKSGDLFRERYSDIVVLLATVFENKLFMIITLGEEAVNKGLDADKIIKEIAGVAGGSGGGRKDFAQGSAPNISNTEKSLHLKLKEIIDRL